MSVRAGAIEEAISVRNLGEIWSGPLALSGSWLRSSFFTPFTWMLRGGAVLVVLVWVVPMEVLSSLVKALTNCKIQELNLGPVVQSIVSLTSSLRGQLVECFTTLYQLHWYFLLKKWEKLLHCKNFSHFFNNKYWHIWDINVWNFNEMWTNDSFSFEQPGPGL